ncbi:MAG: ATP-binding protein, partial [Thermodesulfovibrionales bacterium]
HDKFLSMLSGSMPVIEMNKNTELNLKTKDDHQLIISITSALVKNSEGEDIGKVFTFRDITEEKQRQEVYHRTEKLVALGQLSAGIAHELNTPLGSILGYARLLLKNKKLDEQQRERLEIIAEQAKRSSAIIKGLLNFARQSNPYLRNMKDAWINDILTDVLKLLQTEIEKHGINVITDFGQVPAARVDVRQIEQAMLNIILNAIQAIKNDGEIRIKTFVENNSIKIEVSDNGPGIPEDIRPRIFDPFFTTKPVGEGTGLGLSISAGIISEHGGSIDVESTEGNGATFTITLPITPPSPLK